MDNTGYISQTLSSILGDSVTTGHHISGSQNSLGSFIFSAYGSIKCDKTIIDNEVKF